MKHLKRLAIPKTWSIKKKENVFVVRPLPRVKFELGIPLTLVLRDYLNYAKTTKEVKYILNNKEVLINGKRVKEKKYLLGFMDVLSFPEIKKNFRLLLNKKGKLFLKEISDEESKFKLCKIIGKTKLKGGKTQINCDDGTNIIVDKDNYKVRDTIVLEFPNKIKDVLKFEKGALAYLIKGSHIGDVVKIKEIKEKNIVIEKNGKEFETLKDYAFIIGKEKPFIDIEENEQ